MPVADDLVHWRLFLWKSVATFNKGFDQRIIRPANTVTFMKPPSGSVHSKKMLRPRLSYHVLRPNERRPVDWHTFARRAAAPPTIIVVDREESGVVAIVLFAILPQCD